MEILKFKNVDNKPVRLKHAAMGAVILQPGQETVLPIEYATLNVGHPNARDEDKNKWRTNAFKHIRRRWGFYPGLMTEAEWETMKPKVELYTLDGERVLSVIEDPEGVRGGGVAAPAEGNGEAFLQQQVATMQKQIEQLTSLIAQQQGTTPAPVPAAPQQTAEDITNAQLAAAMQQVTADSPIEDAIPTAPKGEKVGKDGPRTTRVGSR